jgi:hypothetical protein
MSTEATSNVSTSEVRSPEESTKKVTKDLNMK